MLSGINDYIVGMENDNNTIRDIDPISVMGIAGLLQRYNFADVKTNNIEWFLKELEDRFNMKPVIDEELSRPPRYFLRIK